MVSRCLELGAVETLRAVALRFGPEHATAKSRALADIATRAVTDAAVLLAYHDCLLCLIAYPETRALRDAARRELRRVAAAARELFASGPARDRAKLANSGIAFTDVTINFGWDIARWLVERFPRRADIDSFGEDGLPPQEIVGEALPPMEFDLCARDWRRSNSLRKPKDAGERTSLAWLVGALGRLQCTDALRARALGRDAALHRHPARPLDAVAHVRARVAGANVLSPRRASAQGSTSPRSSTSRCRRRGASRAPTGNA